MPRGGSKPGERRGGRQKGTPNRRTADIEKRLADLKCDPIEGMARIATGQAECLECHGKGKQKYSPSIGGPYVDPTNGVLVICYRCHGTKLEPVPIKLRAEMFAELAQYVLPKRKAIEVSAPDDDGPGFRGLAFTLAVAPLPAEATP